MKIKPRSPFCIHPRVKADAPGEIRTLTVRGLSTPPAAGVGPHALLVRAAGVEPAPRLCLREPPLPFGLRALSVIGAGGETRTHKNRLLRAARLPFAPLPPIGAGGGTRTLNEPSHSRRPQRRAFAFYATPARKSTLRTGSGRRTRTFIARFKGGHPPLRRPRTANEPGTTRTCGLKLRGLALSSI